MSILAIDTAASLCAACVLDARAGERGREVLDLGKGHAERLMAVIDAALKRSGSTFADLSGIAVSVGPGSFTGVRVGVATARGLALALKIPAVGVTTLEALAGEAREVHPGRPVIAAIDAGRGQIYAAAFSPGGRPATEPAVLEIDRAIGLVADSGATTVLAGSAARMLAEAARRAFEIAAEGATADIGVYARFGAERLAGGAPEAGRKPKPLYLRAADAKPQTGFALPRRTAP